MKLFKSIAEYFPHIIMWLDGHKVYGTFIFILVAFFAIVSGYAYNQSTDTEAKVYSLEKTMDQKHANDESWRNTITNRLDVMDGKLDLLIELKRGE